MVVAGLGIAADSRAPEPTEFQHPCTRAGANRPDRCSFTVSWGRFPSIRGGRASVETYQSSLVDGAPKYPGNRWRRGQALDFANLCPRLLMLREALRPKRISFGRVGPCRQGNREAPIGLCACRSTLQRGVALHVPVYPQLEEVCGRGRRRFLNR
jgi:hypothetical protein